MSTIATSGGSLAHLGEQLLGVAGRAGDLEAGLGEQPGDALAEQHRVVGERHPHGAWVSLVAPASLAIASSVPVTRITGTGSRIPLSRTSPRSV